MTNSRHWYPKTLALWMETSA